MPEETIKIRYCLYSRKSTEEDERQALSIESQIKEMLQIAKRDGLEVIDVRRESHSAKASGTRPVYKQMLEDVRDGQFNAILTWAPDRLSRNAGDLGELVDLMDRRLLYEIRTYNQKFTNSPNEKFLLMILGSQAKLENDNRSINVKRGLRSFVEMGRWPGVPPTGYLNEKRSDKKGSLIIDPKRGHVIKKMYEKVAEEQWSGRQIHEWLKKEMKFTTVNGKPLSLSNVYIILKNPFYYGRFEYPRGSDNWYTGSHEPVINKALYDKVQEWLERHDIKRSETKEFAFTKLITCGLCGSGITADEKLKRLKDGSVARYVYYGCTKAKDITCKTGYIREKELIKQLLELVDTINLDELGMRERLEAEVERYRKFQAGVLGIKNQNDLQKEVSIRNYAKYLLQSGTIFEKRELLSSLRSRLILRNKTIKLDKGKLLALNGSGPSDFR